MVLEEKKFIIKKKGYVPNDERYIKTIQIASKEFEIKDSIRRALSNTLYESRAEAALDSKDDKFKTVTMEVEVIIRIKK